MNRAMLIVALAVGLIAWGSWLFRYDLRPVSSKRPAAYLLDRWTGSTYFLRQGTVFVWWEKIESEAAVVQRMQAGAPAAKSRDEYPWEANDPVVSESAPAAKSRGEKPGK